MSKGSGGGGGRGGVGKTGVWIKFKDGRKRVSVIFNKPEVIGGEKYHSFGVSWQQASKHGTTSGYFKPKGMVVFNNKYDIGRNTPLSKYSETASWVNTAANMK